MPNGGKGGQDSFGVALLRDIEFRVMFEGVLWPESLHNTRRPARVSSASRDTEWGTVRKRMGNMTCPNVIQLRVSDAPEGTYLYKRVQQLGYW